MRRGQWCLSWAHTTIWSRMQEIALAVGPNWDQVMKIWLHCIDKFIFLLQTQLRWIHFQPDTFAIAEYHHHSLFPSSSQMKHNKFSFRSMFHYWRAPKSVTVTTSLSTVALARIVAARREWISTSSNSWQWRRCITAVALGILLLTISLKPFAVHASI